MKMSLRFSGWLCAALAALPLWTPGTAGADEGYRPPPGSNQVLSVPLAGAEGLEVIVSDVMIPPNSRVPPHSHPGEEFVYVIEGEAVHVEEGREERVYKAGEAFAIPPGVVHAPYTRDKPARAIVFRVHVEGEPLRTRAE